MSKLQNMCEPAPTPLKESGAGSAARAERAPKKILRVEEGYRVGAISIKI